MSLVGGIKNYSFISFPINRGHVIRTAEDINRLIGNKQIDVHMRTRVSPHFIEGWVCYRIDADGKATEIKNPQCVNTEG